MSTFPVYIGRWHDHTHGSILGDVVTLDVRWGGYLIAALSTFVGFMGTALWSLLAFTIHQCRAKRDKGDGVYLQQQVVYRNAISPLSAALDLMKICYAWRKTRESGVRAQRLKFRSILIAMPPLVVFAAFVTAGVFVSEVAGKSYRSNNVRVKAGLCGFFAFKADSLDGERAEQQKIVNDTLAGRVYATNCYGSNNAIAACSLYPTQALQYNTSEVQCPFGRDPEGRNLCLFAENSALQLDTGLMDSNDAFGINAAWDDRILTRKRLTCSPIGTSTYLPLANPGDEFYEFYFGPIYGVSNFTYLYPTHTALDKVGYQITAVYAGKEAWSPVQALQVADGQTSLYFLAANSIYYLAPVKDLWFSANDLITVIGDTFYGPDYYVNVMACVDQWQICNTRPNPYDYTIIGSIRDVSQAFEEIGLNINQLATAQRIIVTLALTSTFNAVNLLGDTALLARNHLVRLIGTGLPATQWQIEVQGWFETSLAKIQSYVLEYVTNSVDLGPYGFVNSPSPYGNAFSQAAAGFCSEQRIRNVGGYQTFSFLGLMIVVCVGSTIILLSLVIEPIVGWIWKRSPNRKHDYREMARIADRKLQLQRMALMGAGYVDSWQRALDAVPVTTGNMMFALPTRKTTNGVDDHHYASSEEPLLQQDHHTERENGVPGLAAMPPEHLPRQEHDSGPE